MSYQFELDPKSEAATRLISEVGEKLQRAFAQEKSCCGLTLQGLAKRLDVDKSHVHRTLSGHNNMTLRTLAETAWALDREMYVSFLDSKAARHNDYLGYSCKPNVITDASLNVAQRRDVLTTSTHARCEIFFAVDNVEA